MSAVGGDVSTIAAYADVRLPVRTHPLQAFVTNGYAQGLDPIVSVDRPALLRLADRARPDADRCTSSTRESSYSRASRRSSSCRVVAQLKMAYLLPFLRDLRDPPPVDRDLRHLARLLADHGASTGVGRPRDHHRLGNLGIQGHPGGRARQMAETDRDRRTRRSLIASVRPLSGSPPTTPMADQGSTGTR